LTTPRNDPRDFSPGRRPRPIRAVRPAGDRPPDPDDFETRAEALGKACAGNGPLVEAAALAVMLDYQTCVAAIAGSNLPNAEKIRRVDRTRRNVLHTLAGLAARRRATPEGGGPC
jgi:hypothetical protein